MMTFSSLIQQQEVKYCQVEVRRREAMFSIQFSITDGQTTIGKTCKNFGTNTNLSFGFQVQAGDN